MYKIILLIFIALIQSSFAEYFYKDDKRIILTETNEIDSKENLKYYKIGNTKIGINDKIIVKFKNIVNLNEYLEEFNLTIEKEIEKNLYLVKTKNKDLTLNIANNLHEKNDIIFAQPDFVIQAVSR